MSADEAEHYGLVVVGAGHGAVEMAANLTRAQYDGRIAVIGDEVHLPYDRPPLSKGFLSGETSAELLALRPQEYWNSSKVEFILGDRVVEVHPDSKTVRTATGRTVGYEHLVWSAGGYARSLPVPGADLAGVHCIRTLDSVAELAQDLRSATRVVIIGAGYIGLEAAAVLRTYFDLPVTVVEAQDRVLARVTSPPISDYFQRRHRNSGVELLLEEGISEIIGDDGKVSGVRLASGRVVDAEVVVVGIGIVPAVEPLAVAGALCSNGVDVDTHCRTNLPGVYAVGDCSNQENPFGKGKVRIESVPNVTDQAKRATASITNQDVPAPTVPWFWSNQYETRLKTVGILTGYDHYRTVGDPNSDTFGVLYVKDGNIIAGDFVNDNKGFARLKKLANSGQRLTESALCDETDAVLASVTTDQARSQ